MRYYKIVITDPTSGKIVRPPAFASLNLDATYTSFINGQSIPGALNVELDIPVAPYGTPIGAAAVRIWGISVQEISQAADLNGKNIQVFAGFQKGLPLANPAQAGLIVEGFVFQAFGNWIGKDMTLDLIISPGTASKKKGSQGGTGTVEEPKNIVLAWRQGMALGQAVQNALGTAFQGYQLDIGTSAKLVRSADDVGYFQTLTQFSQYLKQASISVMNDPKYNGVDVALSGKQFKVYDGTKASSSSKEVSYQDLIGQPTWIESPSIQFKTAMRSDLKVGDVVALPKTVITNTQAALSSQVNQRLNFQGKFNIQVVRHVGNFRQADAASWVTVFNAYPQSVS